MWEGENVVGWDEGWWMPEMEQNINSAACSHSVALHLLENTRKSGQERGHSPSTNLRVEEGRWVEKREMKEECIRDQWAPRLFIPFPVAFLFLLLVFKGNILVTSWFTKCAGTLGFDHSMTWSIHIICVLFYFRVPMMMDGVFAFIEYFEVKLFIKWILLDLFYFNRCFLFLEKHFMKMSESCCCCFFGFCQYTVSLCKI
jgi:hypothetical protein